MFGQFVSHIVLHPLPAVSDVGSVHEAIENFCHACFPEDKSTDDTDKTAHDKSLDSIREMYAALRACWTPPPKDEARHGMEYTIRFAFRRDGQITAPPRRTYSSHEAPDEVRDTYRDAVGAALKRCTPLHFSRGMAGAMAGRPIAIRFVDERTLANSIDKAKSPQ
jgi:hypothetical protein